MTPTLKQYLILCPFVFLAGLVDSVAGGGGLISIPAYLASGLPAHMAIGSNKFSASFASSVSSIRYFKGKRVDLKTAAVSIAFALIGSALGARTVLYVDPVFLSYVMLAIIPFVAFFVLKKKDFGAVSRVAELPLPRVLAYSAGIGFTVGFYDGFFGPGAGTFFVLLYTGLLKYDLITASGNAKVINLASGVSALVVFIIKGQVAYALAIPAMFCGVTGSFIGSGLALKKGAKVIRPMFVGALILLIAYILKDLLGM